MSLQEQISADLKSAMKSGDALRLQTLRTLRAGLLEKQIERRGAGAAMTPEDETGVLVSAAKRRKESIEQFARGGRQDLADQESRELAIIQEYLPKQMDREEVRQVIQAIIAGTGAHAAAGFGAVMSAAMKQLKGRADGKVVQELVKELLVRT